MRVSDIMSKKVKTISKDVTVTKALSLMERARIKALPVLSNKKLVGLITLQAIIAYPKYSIDLKVSKLMFKPPKLNEDSDLFDGLRLMKQTGVSGIPVTKAGEVIGFLSDYDVIKALKKEFEGTVVSNFMRVPPPSLNLDDPVSSARGVFHYEKVSSIPIVDKKRLVGVLSENSFFSLYKPHESMGYGVEGRGESKGALNMKVRDVLIRPFYYALITDKTSKVVNLMIKHRLSSLILVNEHMEPKGYVSRLALVGSLYGKRKPEGLLLTFTGMELDDEANEMLTKVLTNHLERVAYLAKKIKTVNIRIKSVHSDRGSGKYELKLQVNLTSGVSHRVKKVGYDLRECLNKALGDIEKLMKKNYKK